MRPPSSWTNGKWVRITKRLFVYSETARLSDLGDSIMRMNAGSIESGNPARLDNSTLPTDSSVSSYYGIGKVFHLDDKLVFGIAIALLVAAFLFLVLTCCCCIRLRRQHRKPKKYGLLATSEREADFLNSGMTYDYDDEEENHTLFVNSRSKQT
ncbi:hypothetical protein SprV_0100401800 [Sparganum proliferum]